jgi:uncharacterized protein (DUF433 family)
MTDQTIIPINYIERKPDSSKYRIAGKGVTVEFLVLFIDDPDWPVERICDNFGLTPAEVHAAWAFYYDHQAKIDQHLQAAQAFEDALPDHSNLRAILLQRLQERKNE